MTTVTDFFISLFISCLSSIVRLHCISSSKWCSNMRRLTACLADLRTSWRDVCECVFSIDVITVKLLLSLLALSLLLVLLSFYDSSSFALPQNCRYLSVLLLLLLVFFSSFSVAVLVTFVVTTVNVLLFFVDFVAFAGFVIGCQFWFSQIFSLNSSHFRSWIVGVVIFSSFFKASTVLPEISVSKNKKRKKSYITVFIKTEVYQSAISKHETIAHWWLENGSQRLCRNRHKIRPKHLRREAKSLKSFFFFKQWSQ